MNAPGIPFIRVAEDILDFPLRLVGELPFGAGGETRAAPPPEARSLHLPDDVCRSHFQKRFAGRDVAVPGDVLIDALRINGSPVLEHDQLLLGVEGDVVEGRDGFCGSRLCVEESLHGPALEKVLLHEVRDIFLRELLVENVPRLDDHDRTLGTEPVTTGLDDPDLMLQFMPGKFSLEDIFHFLTS